jgi:hypothetical protein
MFNRYVDGLASLTPTDPEAYKEMGKRMVQGYALPQKPVNTYQGRNRTCPLLLNGNNVYGLHSKLNLNQWRTLI